MAEIKEHSGSAHWCSGLVAEEAHMLNRVVIALWGGTADLGSCSVVKALAYLLDGQGFNP